MTEKGGERPEILRGSFLQVGFHKKKKEKKIFFPNENTCSLREAASASALPSSFSSQAHRALRTSAHQHGGCLAVVGVRKCMSHGKGRWRHGEVGMAAGQRSWHPPAPQRTDRRGGGAFERASASQCPRATWPRRAARPPCSCSAGATDHRPQPCRGRQRCCWLCSGDVSVRNGALQPNQRLAADQSPRARTALARSCPVGPPGPRGLSPDAGAECGSIPQRPALRAGAARCRLCRVRRPPSLLAGRVGVAAGVVSCRVYLWGPCGTCRARVPCRSASPPSASSTEAPSSAGDPGRCADVSR